VHTGPKNGYNRDLDSKQQTGAHNMTTDALDEFKKGYAEGRADLLEFVHATTGLKFETVAELVIFLMGVK
jgi:hypothetical protein